MVKLKKVIYYLFIIFIVSTSFYYFSIGMDIMTASYVFNIKYPIIMLVSSVIFISLPLFIFVKKKYKLFSIVYFLLKLLNFFILGSFYKEVGNVMSIIYNIISYKNLLLFSSFLCFILVLYFTINSKSNSKIYLFYLFFLLTHELLYLINYLSSLLFSFSFFDFVSNGLYGVNYNLLQCFKGNLLFIFILVILYNNLEEYIRDIEFPQIKKSVLILLWILFSFFGIELLFIKEKRKIFNFHCLINSLLFGYIFYFNSIKYLLNVSFYAILFCGLLVKFVLMICSLIYILWGGRNDKIYKF